MIRAIVAIQMIVAIQKLNSRNYACMQRNCFLVVCVLFFVVITLFPVHLCNPHIICNHPIQEVHWGLGSGTDIFVQKLVSWHMFHHVTTWFSSFSWNSHWDSAFCCSNCSISVVSYFVKYVGVCFNRGQTSNRSVKLLWGMPPPYIIQV
jgi:hypothetical protein